MNPPPSLPPLDKRERKENPLKLLVAIASYGTAGDKYLYRLIEEYRSMSLDVDIVVFSNIERQDLPSGVEIEVGLPTRDPWSLPFAHKKILAKRINDYDLFLYSENDTLVTQKNIEAFLRVSEMLPETEIVGFLRYENGSSGSRKYINLHGHYHWDPKSVCKRGSYTFASLTNEHSACYLLTKKQLQQAISSGRYLVPPYSGKYDLACTASTDPYTVCGFRKVICISQLDDFLVHHLPDKYSGPEFSGASEEAFKKQIETLMALGASGAKPVSLLTTETRLPAAKYSKEYDEATREEVLASIPYSVREVLSIGSGFGRAELSLQKKGYRVTALALDPVVGACLDDSGIEVLYEEVFAAREKLKYRKFDCLFISNILHLVPHPEEFLQKYAELLNPGGYVLIVTPNVATLKNRLFALLHLPGYRDLKAFRSGGVQFLSLGRVKNWLAASGLAIETVRWAASPRFKSLVQTFPGLFGRMFGAEFISLCKKTA
jgi:SAM-dependent methyltransferase